VGALALAAILALAPASCADVMGPPERLDALPRPLSVAEQEVITSANDFSFRLLRRVVEDDDETANVILSPFSVSMALGMTLNGAGGTTFDSMRSALGVADLDQERINSAYHDLTALLLGLDSRTETRIANSLWARRGFPFEASFFQTVRQVFGAHAEELDFAAPEARGIINGWVRDNTGGRIDDIVQEITPDDILFLVNAVYFKGQWTQRFDPAETRPAPFHLPGISEPVEVPTMSGTLDVGTFRDLASGVAGGELPYGAQAFTMVVVMPPPGTSVDDLVASLDASIWDSWMQRIRYAEAPVLLPKLEVAYETRLNEPLARMGMRLAFDPDHADFSRISPVSGVYLSRVRHKTFLQVDEEGTEAAAATSVGVGVTSVPAGLVVDRPFVLAIRERLSGTILFLGVVRDPR